jgi:L-fucono-1,5-lactonase
MKIDAHHHLWDPTKRDYPWMSGARFDPIRRRYDLADLTAETVGVGVSATVLVQTVSATAESEEFLAVAAASGGLIAGVIGWVDLTAPAVEDELACLADAPGGERLVGIRHQVEDEPDPYWMGRADVSGGLEAVGRAGLVYDLLVRADGIAACVEVAAAHEDLQFVLDHAGKPPIAGGALERWHDDLVELARRPNVAVKLSGLVTEASWRSWTPADLAPVVDHVLDAFGTRRTMFGSDWPVCELVAGYETVVATAEALTAGLSAVERDDVFAGTASRIYALSLP